MLLLPRLIVATQMEQMKMFQRLYLSLIPFLVVIHDPVVTVVVMVPFAVVVLSVLL